VKFIAASYGRRAWWANEDASAAARASRVVLVAFSEIENQARQAQFGLFLFHPCILRAGKTARSAPK
jgi:hypothetical protein